MDYINTLLKYHYIYLIQHYLFGKLFCSFIFTEIYCFNGYI